MGSRLLSSPQGDGRYGVAREKVEYAKAGKLQLHLGPKEDAAAAAVSGVRFGDYFSSPNSPSSGGTWRIRFSISGRKEKSPDLVREDGGRGIPRKNV